MYMKTVHTANVVTLPMRPGHLASEVICQVPWVTVIQVPQGQ